MLHVPDGGGDGLGRVVVEHPLPARGEDAPGQEDGELGLAVGHRLGGQLERGPGQAAVLALLDVEGEVGQAEPSPLLLQLLGGQRVEGEVDGPEHVGVQRAGVLERPGRGHVEAVDEDDDLVAAEHGRLGRLAGALLELLVLHHVLAVEPDAARST